MAQLIIKSKKNVYDESIAKVSAIDTNGFVLKTKNMIQINQVLKIKSMTQSKKIPVTKILNKKQIIMLKLLK